jgi:hypothetical protein
MNYLSLISVGLGFLEQYLVAVKKNNATPVEVVTSIQSVVDALGKHKDDLITKAALEAERG